MIVTEGQIIQNASAATAQLNHFFESKTFHFGYFFHIFFTKTMWEKKPSMMHLNWLICRHRSVEQSQPVFARGSVTTTNFEPLSMWDTQA